MDDRSELEYLRKMKRLQELEAKQAEPASLTWGDVGSQAIRNTPKSAAQFAGNIYQTFRHPVDTAENIYKLGSGIVQQIIPGEQGNEKYASAVGQFFADRYGGVENIKKTIAEDPVGFLADASTVLTAGGALAAKLPGVAGKVGAAVRTVGKTIDPVTLAVKAAKPVLKVAGNIAAGTLGSLGTHTGGESIKTAAKAGYRGGQAADDFSAAFHKATDMEDVVSDAKGALGKVAKARGESYRAGIASVKADKTILDLGPIDDAVSEVSSFGQFKGQIIAPSTVDTMVKIRKVVDNWKSLDPADFHTPEGLDALKKVIGDIRDSTEFRSPSRVVADKVYNAVKGQIVKQDPEYGKMMKAYEEATRHIKELEKTLSLGEKASSDTSLRKLQSVMRNNVNTNYGKRLQLVEELKDAGASTIMEKLAGHSIDSWSPRGLGKLVAAGTGGASYFHPELLPLLAVQSPKAVGGAAFYGGKAAGGANRARQALNNALAGVGGLQGVRAGAFQAGRLNDEGYEGIGERHNNYKASMLADALDKYLIQRGIIGVGANLDNQ